MRTGIIKKVITLGIVVIILMMVVKYQGEIRSGLDFQQFKDFVESFGVWGLLVYVLLGSLRPFFFIPSAPIFIIGGVIYGTLIGSLLNVISLLIGASLCYFLASRFQRLFSRFVSKSYLERLEKLKGNNIIRALFIIRVTPAFPFDPISYGAGLTGINYYDFFIGTFLGCVPKLILYTFLGDGIEDVFSYRTILVFTTLGILALMALLSYRKKTTDYN